MSDFFKNDKQPKCIILDWDGTLVDVEPVIHKAYKATLQELNSPLKDAWSPVDTHQQNGLAPKDIFDNELIWGDYKGEDGLAKQLFYKHYRALMAEDKEAPYLKEGALELLQTLNAAYPTARVVILAAKTHDILNNEVASKSELSPWVNAVWGTDAKRGFSKQNDAIFHEAVFGLDISDNPHLRMEEVVYIGDNVDKDTDFARICQISPVIVNDKDKRADYISLNELTNAVRTQFRERNMALLKSQKQTPHINDIHTNG